MKKIIIIFVFVLSIFLVSCKVEEAKPKTNNINPTEKKETEVIPSETQKETQEPTLVDPTTPVDHTANTIEPTPIVPTPEPTEVEFPYLTLHTAFMYLDESYELPFMITDYQGYLYYYDYNSIEIKLDYENNGFDCVFAKTKGTFYISVIKDDIATTILQLTVIDKNDVLEASLPSSLYLDDEYVVELSNDVLLSIDNDCISYDEDTKTLKAIKVGSSTITITSKYDEELKKEFCIDVLENISDSDKVLVKSDESHNKGEEVIIDGLRYYYGLTLFNKISDALVNSKEIYIDSTNEQNITINKSDVSLVGCSEKELNLVINVNEFVSNIKISNLHFTSNSKISFTGGNTNITIQGNTFSNTTANSTSWVATNKYTDGIITFVNSSNYYDNVLICDNTFNNIGDCGVNASTMHNFTFSGNTFDGFPKDAVRMNNGIVRSECTWEFSDNSFSNGEYSGIYFRTYASDTVDFYHYVIIRDNTFDNVGKNGGEYVAAILFRNYQEGCVSVDIRYNTFSNCKKFIFLRNNAIESHQANFTGFVGYNTFKTVPSNYYFNNLNNSDTNKLNPKQAILNDNVYLDGSGNDITPNSSKIIGAYESTTITKGALESLSKITVPYLMIVGKGYELGSWVGSNEYFNKTDDLTTPTKVGLYKLYNGGKEFNVKCVAKIELVVRFINIALGEVGYEEMDANGNTGTSGNYTKYGEWYGINPGAWCAMFVSWCANQAGVSTSVIPKYASVQIGMDWYKDKGLFQYKEDYTPKAGDIMFMKSNGASHTGIVLYCDGKTLYTVEGNTSDTCACRKYSVDNAKITGYGTPQWSYYSPDGYNFSSGQPQDGSGHSTT